MAKFSVLIGEAAKQEFLAIPFPYRRQVNQRIFRLKADPWEGAELVPGSTAHRIDVAGWRVLYEIDDSAQTITVIAFRKVDLG